MNNNQNNNEEIILGRLYDNLPTKQPFMRIGNSDDND